MPKTSKNQRRILVVRNDKVGDLIIATPALKALRESFPDAFISAWVSIYAKDVLSNNPYVDKVIVEDENGKHKGLRGLLLLVEEIKKERFDTAVVIFPFFRNALAVFLARIPIRISTGFRWYQFLFNRLTYLRRSKALRHEIDYAIELVEMAGAKPIKGLPELYPSKDDYNYAEDFFSKNGIRKDNNIIIGINPGSGLSARKWPEKCYIELSKRLIEKIGADIIIFWGPGEKAMAEEMARAIGKGSVIASETNILQLAAFISNCSLFITNNTGPMHIAAATDTPMIAIFDPKKACAPERWGYEDEKRIVLKPHIDCNDSCRKKRCGYDECMELVTVDMVFKSAQKLLGSEILNQRKEGENA